MYIKIINNINIIILCVMSTINIKIIVINYKLLNNKEIQWYGFKK